MVITKMPVERRLPLPAPARFPNQENIFCKSGIESSDGIVHIYARTDEDGHVDDLDAME